MKLSKMASSGYGKRFSLAMLLAMFGVKGYEKVFAPSEPAKFQRSPLLQTSLKAQAEIKRQRRRTRNLYLVFCGGMSAAREEV